MTQRHERSAESGMALLEMLFAGVLVVLIAVPSIGLLVSSRQGIAASWNETVARNLAAEALEWGATVPLDGLSGPIALDELPIQSIAQARLMDGRTLDDPSFVRDAYTYPEGCRRFSRRLQVTDASPGPGMPLLRLTATVTWTEPGGPEQRVRTVQLWRLIGP